MEKNHYAKLEEETLKFWQQNKVFEKSVEQRPIDAPYVFYDGPPFATGLPHYGHILSSVIKDLIPRYFTMKGKRVERRWGWDCHGLPIETLVEKELNISGKKEIEKIGIDKFNAKARSMVLTYADLWRQTISRIGRWVEFDNSYKTMDTSYMESVWWALKTLWDKNFIYEGRKVLMYCPRCETPVSNAEISMDNSYKDVTEETVIVKFKVKHPEGYGLPEDSYLLAWTTTPWTLPANVALAVGKDIDYAVIEAQGENFVLADNLIEKSIKGEYKKIKSIKGSEFDGLEYEPLFEIPAVAEDKNLHWIVTIADFVTTEDGTGIVHTAVAYGEDDYKLGQQIGLSVVPLLTSSGKYNVEAPEFLKGRDYKESEDSIKEDLKSRNLLYSTFDYTHSYPFCWRCESPLIYNAVSAWFIDIQSSKKRIIELNEKINWYPKYLKHGRFLNILESAPDWNISRNRYWATPLPFFKCDKCTHTECIGSIEELQNKSINFSEVYTDKSVDKIDLHRPYVDQIKLTCPECSGEMRRISEVIDCWVESASMPFAQLHYPFENKDVFERRFPGQFIGEYISQTRAWFYYMHALSTLLFDSNSFENVVSTGVILNEKGEKMSKSKKNYPDPTEMIDRYGVDSLRFYLMSSVVMQADNLFFNEKDLREAYNKVVNLAYNIANFYQNYSGEAKKAQGAEISGVLDLWMISRLNSAIGKITECFDGYDTVHSAKEIRSLLDDISTWWLRRSRERFRSDNEPDRQSALATLQTVVYNLSLILAPITPFASEYLYQLCRVDGDAKSSHLCAWPKHNSSSVKKNLEQDMEIARKVVEAGHSLRSENSLRVRQPLASIFIEHKFSQNQEEYEKIISDELNVEKFAKNIVEISDPVQNDSKEVKVVLDKKLDDRLISLGDIRDVLRAIQQLRKKIGLKAGDLARLEYDGELGAVELVTKNQELIKKQTAVQNVSKAPKDESFVEIKTSKGSIFISISETSSDSN